MAGFPQAVARAVAQAQRPPVAIHSAAKSYYFQGTTLLQQRRFAEAEAHLRQALSMRPDDADVLNNLGTAVWEQGRSSEATAFYLRAYQYKRNDFGILNNLGITLWEQGRPETAIVYYRRALQLQPDSFDTQMNLGVSLSDLGQFDEALVWLRGSLKLRPESADAWDNVGMTLARKGLWDEAMKCYDKAVEFRSDLGEARRNRALGWLAHGDFERGFPESEWRLKCRNPPGYRFPRPLWAGEPLEGKTILLHYEQGFGDTLQFIRFAPQVKERGGVVWVFNPPPIPRLLALCPSIDRVVDGSPPFPDFPIHAPLLSVPAILKTTSATFPRDPYLAADTASIERWRPALVRALGVSNPDSVFKIGIAWQGSPLNKIDRWRSFPLSHFAQLSKLPGVRLISLQVGPGTEQLAAQSGRFPVAELSCQIQGLEDKRDFLDTAAVMSLLDLVITPETAVAHLAGALGVRTWVALSTVGDWRWMITGDSCPWYPSARLFRQTTLGDWDGVFRQMEERLAQELAQRNEPGRHDG
jgi:Flp pilus assembly protein TadD